MNRQEGRTVHGTNTDQEGESENKVKKENMKVEDEKERLIKNQVQHWL